MECMQDPRDNGNSWSSILNNRLHQYLMPLYITNCSLKKAVFFIIVQFYRVNESSLSNDAGPGLECCLLFFSLSLSAFVKLNTYVSQDQYKAFSDSDSMSYYLCCITTQCLLSKHLVLEYR